MFNYIRKKFLACFLVPLFFSNSISSAMDNSCTNISSVNKIENLNLKIKELFNKIAETLNITLDSSSENSFNTEIKKSIEIFLDSEIGKLLDDLTKETGVILEEQEKKVFINVIKNFIENSKGNINLKELINLFKFSASGKEYMLVPMCKTEKHKDCLMKIFCEEGADGKKREYMKYYLRGNLFTKETVEKRFFTGVRFENNKIRSLPLMPAFEDKIIGRIGIGPLTYHPDVCLEIGYALEQEYSGQRIMSNAVECVLKLLQFLKDKGIYEYTKLRATAKPNNGASNKILSNLNFVKSEDFANDGYGVENEYYYNFK